ncbi:SpoIVB peptidase [Bacillaceae bacterium W0354]
MIKSRLKIHLILLVSFILPFIQINVAYAENDHTVSEVIPGGQSVGIKLHTSGVVVVGFSKTDTKEEKVSAAQKAGVKVGDIILQLDDKKIKDMDEFVNEIKKKNKDGESVKLLIKRKEHIFPITVKPIYNDKDELYRLGLYIRDATAGIGTMTFYDPKSKRYGALGHIIMDHQTKKPIDIYNGKIVTSDITSINKSGNGSPGEKRARFSLEDESLGTIQRNSDFGIFGKLNNDKFFNGPFHKPIPVAKADEVKEGKAKIYTVVNDDRVEAFDVEIVSSEPSDNPETKGMIIKITDKDLLEKTGGIVQGMSGSPIIQDGKLVGAVTHVFLNDPTSGYGVHIEWMLNEAGLEIQSDTLKEAS